MSSAAGSLGTKPVAQIWPCGCGCEQPITAPLFSNTCTHGCVRPSSAVCVHQVSTTSPIAARLSSGKVRAWSGEKQMTRLVPRASFSANSGSLARASGTAGTPGISAAWSLVKTKVPS